MPAETLEEAIGTILNEMHVTLINKRRDYGTGSIERTPLVEIIGSWGLDGITTAYLQELGVFNRFHDKYERLRELLKHPSRVAANESIEDTWKDIIGYAVLALLVRRREISLPMSTQTEPECPE
ncbi:MAG: nucleotide modification associated domain-containing protein [Candidatus Poribacteria bacterium]|nr:nucleotide modification associated domain-containing protein [Candidatus Poribacteria bacterium]